MKTIGGGAAMLNGVHDIVLLDGKIVSSAIRISIKPENIGNFMLRAIARSGIFFAIMA